MATVAMSPAEINEVHARLTWRINRPAGVSYPRGEQFATPARFERQGDDWTADAWSLVVRAAGPVLPDATQPVRVRFLMDDAPQEWLSSGSRFELYEGRLLLAEGVVE
jgi:hypothetical protein